jgi:hypothetical protein
MSDFRTEIAGEGRRTLLIESGAGDGGGVRLTLRGAYGAALGRIWLPGMMAVQAAAAITEAHREGSANPVPAVSLYGAGQLRKHQRIVFDGKLYEITAARRETRGTDRPWQLTGAAGEGGGPRRMCFRDTDLIAATECRQ